MDVLGVVIAVAAVLVFGVLVVGWRQRSGSGGAHPFRIRLSLSLAASIMLVVAVTVGAFVVLASLAGSRAAEESAKTLGAAEAARVKDKLGSLFAQATDLAQWISMTPGFPAQGGTMDQSQTSLRYLEKILEGRERVYSAYVGYGDGTFLQVIASRNDPKILAALQAPTGTSLIQRTISWNRTARVQEWRFLGGNHAVLGTRREVGPDYDPRNRDWYRKGQTTTVPVLSPVYVFNSNRQPGLTASAALAQGSGVAGVDVTLADLESFLSSNAPGNASVFLLSGGREVIASGSRHSAVRPGGIPALAPLGRIDPSLDKLVAVAAAAGGFASQGSGDSARLVWASQWTLQGSLAVMAVLDAPAADFTASFRTVRDWVVLLLVGVWIVILPLCFLVTAPVSHTIRRLAHEATRLGQLDFSGAPIDSRISELHGLAESFHDMRGLLADRTDELKRVGQVLQRLIELGIALGAERDTEKLMTSILSAAREVSHADGGTLYLRTKADTLQFKIVQTQTLGVDYGSPGSESPPFPEVPLFVDGQPNRHNVVSLAVLEERTISIDDAYHDQQFDFSGTRAFDEANGYRSVSFLTVPLKPRGGQVIGALQLLNATGPEGTFPFPPQTVGFVEALAAEAATALHNRELLRSQEQFLNNMISILASAIDIKSPYTGAHCRRVPELALMLADEVAASGDPGFEGFRFASEDERREFRLASWLHDIGKVTTPEYVVDKATKLETIHNRIHEVRARFEILLRDSRIEALEARLGGTSEAEAEAAYGRTLAQLTDDFLFVAECNLGGEFLAPEKATRLEAIASQTWRRHFDDRLGLSHGELERLEGVPPANLPAEERLLADRPEHRFPRPAKFQLGADGRFAMKVPELLYNHGELYNLRVSRGTLNDEERFKINEHIIQTSLMLDGMDWPDNLARVPRWASTHHEALNGTGYPRGLKADQLDTADRIIAIADIFEALTASDRPYKKAKTLSESVAILAEFRDRGHIDPRLFDLFLTSGLYLRYAEKYLPAAQIDLVDVASWVGPAFAAS